MHPLVKLALDLGPLAAFFVAFRLGGLAMATVALIAATLLALIISFLKEKKISPMPLITGAAVGVMGGLTLWLNDELFIKMKPTFVNLLFSVILFGGLLTGRPLMKHLFGSAIALTERGWRALSLRWAVFFVFLAGVNEAVWRHFPTDVWVDFKVFGMLSMTLLFTLAQLPLMKREMVQSP